MTATEFPAPAARVNTGGRYAPRTPTSPVALNLAGTEGPGDPLDAEFARHAASSAASRYPDTSPLASGLADHFNITPDRVLVTAGADEAIACVFRAYLESGREVVLTSPTFEMLPRYAAMCDASTVSVPWPDARFPVDAIIDAVTPRTTLIAIVTPNNPTGAVATIAELAAIHDTAPGAVLLVDLAYIEYADADPTAALLDLPRVVVVRTFSKAWGLAGARVGYAMGHRNVIDLVAAAGNPFPVAAPSLELARNALLSNGDAMRTRVDAVRGRRTRTANAFTEAGIPISPTQANFVCAAPKDPRWLWDALVGCGIGTRLIEDPQPSRVRMTVPADDDAFARVTEALRTVFAPEALILDMDGVIADVSKSYRAAIIATAAHFGVATTPAEIAALKRGGNANDDWQLTATIVATQRPDITLEDVTEMFESLFHGTGEQPGLWENETLIVRPDLLRRLARRLPLAIATGRPRRDAERFLDRFEITDCMTACVTRDDGAIKPDPFAPREAMRRVGATRGWMIGDTPDDVLASRSAGLLPLGVIAPGDDNARMTEALLRAGAARVIPTLASLENLLP